MLAVGGQEARGEDGGRTFLPLVRVLLIQGGASAAPVHRLIAHLAGLIPNATIATIAGANHLLPLTHPTELGRVVDDFCAR